MKNFRVKPELEFIETLIVYYGIHSLNSNQSFTKNDLIRLNTKQKIVDELLCDLTIYYPPCTIRRIMDKFNEKKAITMLKQFLYVIDYCLDTKDTVKERKKVISYTITSKLTFKNIQVKNEPVLMTFD